MRTDINPSLYFLNSQLGIGWRGHDFVGDELIIMMPSAGTSGNESSTSPSNLLKISQRVCNVDVGVFFLNLSEYSSFNH